MQRNAYFDNAKLVLIFLVVFGHLIQPLTSDMKSISILYNWIYLFHMPAFIFLAGFFANGSSEKSYMMKLAKKLLLPYFAFQFIYTFYYFMIGKEGWVATPFDPHWALWFLFSLFFWHVLLIGYKKIPAVAGILIAITVGIAIGYWESAGTAFSLSRTFAFFPYFLIGYWVKKEHVFKLTSLPMKISSVVVLSTVLVVIGLFPDFSTGWLLHSKSYMVLGEPIYGGIFRLGLYVIAAVMSASLLAWIPKRQGRLSKLGERTLYVYLLHGFFIQFFREADLFLISHPIDILGLAAISLLIVFLLSSKVILGIWQPLIEGKASILKKSWLQTK